MVLGSRGLRETVPGVLSVILLVLSGASRVHAQSTGGNSVLIARPSGGHSGDTFYLSGANLLANHPYTIMMACPDWAHAAMIDPNNVVIVEGPTTDSRGQFVAFPMRALSLQKVPESGCHIYASPGSQPGETVQFGPDIPGDYYIHPSGKRLQTCAVTMCSSRVTATPKRVRAGRYETIDFSAWPGATARVVVSFRGERPQLRTVRLDYHGVYRLRLRAPVGVDQPSQVQVSVRFTLGRYRANTRASFTVVR